MSCIVIMPHEPAYCEWAKRACAWSRALERAQPPLIRFNRPYKCTRLSPRQPVMFAVDPITNYFNQSQASLRRQGGAHEHSVSHLFLRVDTAGGHRHAALRAAWRRATVTTTA